MNSNQIIKTDIIPAKQHFVKISDSKELDKKAICVFVATGFFIDNDTYWKGIKVLRPATINEIDKNGYLISEKKWFNWYYKPKEISFEQSVNEFTLLFDKINKDELKNKKVILPISGGLDSRSQAVSLLDIKDRVHSFSQAFKNGYDEYGIAEKIAKIANFSFQKFDIPEGYLWNKIDLAAKTNKCYAEFTHCVQQGVLDKLESKGGEVFSLGHWGDVLFDKMTDKQLDTVEKQLELLKSKILKPDGFSLAQELWKSWDIEGSFESYFENRLLKLYSQIKIENVNAKIRAFKSLYWAPRWTSVNLEFYREKHPLSLPYYHNDMCHFICEIPEEYLADRKIQIEYIKRKSPKIGKVTWQDKRPFNLFNYHLCKFPYNIPYKIIDKIKRTGNSLLGINYVQRNWEIQFLGKENVEKMKVYINNSNVEKLINKKIIKNYIDKFYKEENKKHTSHSISMLLTLSAFSKHYLNDFNEHIKN